MLAYRSAAVLILLAFGLAPASTAADLIPREVFFGNPQRTNVQISPDGSRLAFLAPSRGVLNVWVQTLGENDARAVTFSAVRPIGQYRWAMNGEQIIYRQDEGGNEDHRLYAVDLTSGRIIGLTPFDGVQARIVGLTPEKPDEIVVALNQRDRKVHDLWRVNIRTGERSMLLVNDEGFVSITVDPAGVPRVASRVHPDGGIDVFVRESDEEWYELIRWPLEDTAASGVVGVRRDEPTVYLRDSRRADTAGLYAYADGPDGPTYELIAENPRADVASVLTHPRTGAIQAVAFDTLRREWKILDRGIRPDWAQLRKVSPGDLSIVSRDLDDQRWIASFVRDDGPRRFYLWDRPTETAEFLFTDRPALDDLTLAPMQPVEIHARDGMILPSYLTLPVGGLDQRLPMVLLVHGGPWSRDTWGYNPLHQWLANRGYAVLSVNFRGSAGFGKRFLNAGNREWSGAMHDDLIDAVNWAVGRGTADPDRVAIMGGSYGGYATLVGLAFTPQFFAAGVDIVGPSHVRTLLESIPPYWEPMRRLFEERIGRLDEPAFLDQISPLTRAGDIVRPLLIGQGRNDPRVKEAESQQIVEAMERNGQPVTYVLFPDEGHGFARRVNSMAFFAITEAFLHRHLGGDYQPIDDALEGSTAEIRAGATLIPGLSGG
ncbi:MAG: S9 family peptidase [Phycisphaerae bacterium]|nr:S9 family peptidase [Phycisphaerae bacterium]